MTAKKFFSSWFGWIFVGTFVGFTVYIDYKSWGCVAAGNPLCALTWLIPALPWSAIIFHTIKQPNVYILLPILYLFNAFTLYLIGYGIEKLFTRKKQPQQKV